MNLKEGELKFMFDDKLQVIQFDVPGESWPKGMSPVDFIIEDEHEIVLVEVKDPSASNAPTREREKFLKKMKTKELTHQELAPKARSTYSFLHLMARDEKPMRLVVVIGVENLSIQPALLMNLNDRLRKRLKKEASQPWRREYITSCLIVSAADFGKAVSNCTVSRSQEA